MNEDHFLNLQPGTIINGRYEVVKCLGTGSMGMVYACRHRELSGHLVAMKVLFAEVARDTVAAQRFRNEIVASYGVSHPNVVRAYEYFRDGDLVAFTMEYIGGGDLADRIGSDESLDIEEILKMLTQMCSGVQAIHEAGIVHRDLKPENILITAQGDIKITDFGIARTGTGPKLTEHGGVVGTIDYVSPEYLEQGQVDARSDIYALGVLAYEMITGEAPFKGKSVIETMTMRLRSDPSPPSSLRADCPAELDAIVLKAMERNPEKRYQGAAEMLVDLRHMGAVAPATSGEELEREGDYLQSDSFASSPSAREFSSEGEIAGTQEVENFYDKHQVLAQTTMIGPEVVQGIRGERESFREAMHAEEDPMMPLESVLTASGTLAGVPKEIPEHEQSLLENGVSGPVPQVSVGQGGLSAARMQQLSSSLYTPGTRSATTLLWWLAWIMVGIGLGLLYMSHVRPDLFGALPREEIPSYFMSE